MATNVSALGSNSSSSSLSAAANKATAMGRDEFLKLLMTQMRNQNPLDPLKDADFVAQLAQFSTLDGIQQMNTNITQMMFMQSLGQGANLIGKTIAYDRTGSSTTGRGVVQSVQVQNNQLQLMVDNKPVALSQVRSIEAK